MAGTRGRDKGEFTNLQGISTSSNGRIVVADSNNQCIQVSVVIIVLITIPFRIWSDSLIPFAQVFSNDGQFKMRFGVRGRSPGQLQRPTGVTVDMNGDIIVADYDNRWISIFSSDGKFKVRETEKNFHCVPQIRHVPLNNQMLLVPVTEQNWCWETDGTQRRGRGQERTHHHS